MDDSPVTEQNDVETRSTLQKIPHWKENISFTLLFLNAQKSNTQKVLSGESHILPVGKGPLGIHADAD